MRVFRTVLLAALVTLVSLSFVERSYAKVYASYVRVTQEGSNAPFDGSFADRSGATIRFFLNHAADSVVINVVPAGGGAAVKTLRKANLAQGDNALAWNGSTNSNTPAPAGAYKFEITAYHRGFAAYTEYHLSTPAIFTRGVGSVNNPALRWFGFIYAASNGGYVTGVARHASFGRQWGNAPDTAQLTTTGVTIGPANRRYATTVDTNGYVYVIGRDDRRIYRYHLDTLNVTLFDSSSYPTIIQGLDVRGSGANKVLYVTSDSILYRIPIGNQNFNTIAPTPIAVAPPRIGGLGLVFWDAKVGQDNSLYAIWLADSAGSRRARGIVKWNLSTGSLPKTLADTVWTSRVPDGDPVTLALYDGATTGASDDVLYMSSDLSAPNTFPSGIHVYTNLNAASPTRAAAWLDPDNNTTQFRGSVATDVVGNVIYFENSNEQVVLVSPPSGPNSYTYTSYDQVTVTAPGVAPILLSIAEARFDGNGDRKPDLLGDTVKVIGIINSTNVQTTNLGYFMQDANAGIHLFQFGLTGAPVLRPGYRVEVIGAIAYFRGTTEISPANLATDITVLDTGNVITPIPLTIGQFMADPERYESRLIQFDLAHPKSFTSAQWPAAGSSANLTIWNGRDTTILRIDSDTEVDGSPYPNFPVRLNGIGTQFTSATAVDTNGYQITPFFVSDFQPFNAPPLPYFRLLSPPNGASIVVDSLANYNITWRKAVDFNNDPITYQFKPVAFPGSLSNNAGADTVKTVTGAQLLTYLGSNPVLEFRWTVLAKDAPNPPVSSIDTFSVTLFRSFTPPPAGWNAQTSGVTTTLYSVKAVTPAIAWAAGAGGRVLRTTNAGANWTSVGGGNIGTADIYAIEAISSTTALVTTSPSASYLFRTTNGGTSWDTVFVQAGGFLNAIKMFDASNGIAVGDPVGGKWTVIRTTNGGTNWARIATEPTQAGSEYGANNGLATIGPNYIWITPGTGSNVYRSTNGGGAWASSALPAAGFTAGVHFANTQVGIVGNSSGAAARTTNGGATWTAVTIGSTGAIYGVAGSSTNIYATRGTGVFKSDNLGQTWASSYGGGVGSLEHISMVGVGSSLAGWVVSNTGGIASFYGNLTDVDELETNRIPETFELAQNYPNPFNPTTTIRYGLPKDAFVSLKVYNILGQEIVTLKNEFQSVGTFSVKWDGRNNAGNQVASGMYLYRIEAKPADGSQPFTSLKKMILLK